VNKYIVVIPWVFLYITVFLVGAAIVALATLGTIALGTLVSPWCLLLLIADLALLAVWAVGVVAAANALINRINRCSAVTSGHERCSSSCASWSSWWPSHGSSPGHSQQP